MALRIKPYAAARIRDGSAPSTPTSAASSSSRSSRLTLRQIQLAQGGRMCRKIGRVRICSLVADTLQPAVSTRRLLVHDAKQAHPRTVQRAGVTVSPLLLRKQLREHARVLLDSREDIWNGCSLTQLPVQHHLF
eukprot:6138265-Amphidinium_carterae.2